MIEAGTRGWFDREQVSQAAQSLLTEVAEPTDDGSALRYSERQLHGLNTRSKLFLAGVAGFIVAVLFVPDLLPGDWLAEGNHLYSVVRWIMIIVPVGFAFAAKERLRRAAQRTAAHDSSVQKLTSQFQELCDARLSPVVGESVNLLPLLPTDCKPNVRCSLFGNYRDKALAMFEVEYTAPFSFSAKKIIAHGHASLAADPDNEQFSRMRTAEAIVFFRPKLDLPDFLIAGKAEPLCGHLTRWVKDAGGRLQDSRACTSLASRFESLCSDPDSISWLMNAELIELLSLRPNCLVQAIGGYVVVVPRTWASATPMETAVAAFEIQLDLDFACAVYEALVTSP